ncbi:MAG TPA: hypothetical protein VMB84_12495, partial [Stellaceae bacterium]|nr:hypothetical protein [Stellaceae bacterium]
GAAAAFATALLGLDAAEIERRRRLGLWAGMAAGAAVVLRELESVARYAMQAKRFASCRQPTLLLVGAASPPEYQATAEALGAVLAQAQIRRLDGEGHAAIDRAPALFVAAVRGFAGGTPQPK